MTTVHEGKMLKHYLKKEGITYSMVQTRLKISSQSLYYQLRREYLTPKFKHKLHAIGISPFVNNHVSQGVSTERMEEMRMELKKIREILELQTQQITELRAAVMTTV